MTFAPAATLLAGVLLISGMRTQYQTPPAAPMNTIPAVVAGLRGTDMVVPEEERKVAGMSDYMMRTFGADSTFPDFTLYVGYYDRQVQGKTIHSPKNCLPGAGWETMSTGQVPVPGSAGTMNRVLLVNRGTRALVYYWYQGRGRIESSEYQVKWDLLRDAAQYGRTEEALVRIVVPVAAPPKGMMPTPTDAFVKAADEMALKVAKETAPMVAKVLPAFPGA
ncbi:MAG: exosortase C-terminal domain/associated protein EpsI [Gemmatimonadota bacterium]